MTPGPGIEPGHIGGRRPLSPLRHPFFTEHYLTERISSEKLICHLSYNFRVRMLLKGPRTAVSAFDTGYFYSLGMKAFLTLS